MNSRHLHLEPIAGKSQKIDQQTILAIETTIDAHLPSAYLAFLAQFGCCGFAGDASVSTGDRTLPIFTFFDDKTLLRNLNVYPDLTAEKRITFAEDMYGNPYVLDALSEKVLYIDFTVNPPVGTKVAMSFGEFLNSIKVDEFGC